MQSGLPRPRPAMPVCHVPVGEAWGLPLEKKRMKRNVQPTSTPKIEGRGTEEGGGGACWGWGRGLGEGEGEAMPAKGQGKCFFFCLSPCHSLGTSHHVWDVLSLSLFACSKLGEGGIISHWGWAGHQEKPLKAMAAGQLVPLSPEPTPPKVHIQHDTRT